MAEEQVLILIKPDGVKRSLTGNVLTKLSQAGAVIIAAKAVRVSKELAREHYRQLQDKPFFGELVDYIQGKIHGKPWERVLAFVYCGDDVVSKMRKIIGATNPEEADPSTIRGAYGRITTKGMYENVAHCSSDVTEAEREIKLWFRPEELTKEIYPVKKVTVEREEKTIWA